GWSGAAESNADFVRSDRCGQRDGTWRSIEASAACECDDLQRGFVHHGRRTKDAAEGCNATTDASGHISAAANARDGPDTDYGSYAVRKRRLDAGGDLGGEARKRCGEGESVGGGHGGNGRGAHCYIQGTLD